MLTDALRSERKFAFASLFCLLAAFAAVSIGKPGTAPLFPACSFHALTGFFCPGCGSTRAMYPLVHGHPLAAFGENALAVLLLPFLIYELLAVLSRRMPVMSTRLRPWAVWTLFAVIVLFGILRNIPVAPFTALAPTDLP